VGLEGLAFALAGEAQDCRAVNEPVDGGDGLGLGGEEAFPVREACVGGDQRRAVAVPSRDQAEEVLGCGGVEGVIAELSVAPL